MAQQFVPLPSEIWKPIVGFSGYEVSNLGRVRSLPRVCHRAGKVRAAHTVHTNGKILKGDVSYRNGRPVVVRVTLSLNGAVYKRAVHRLVLEAFVGPCPDGLEGCHNDGDPLRNCLENIRWDTHLANMADQERHGTRILPAADRGERNHNARLTDAQVAEIRALPREGMNKAQVARDYGSTRQTIRLILDGKTRVKGYG
jgi:hypothetical protein